MGEQRPDLMGEPCGQFGPAVRIDHQFDAETDLRERHRPDVEQIQRLFGDKCYDLARWPSLANLREDVGVEQPVGHRSTSRTGIRTRGGSMLVDRCGDIRIASTRAVPQRFCQETMLCGAKVGLFAAAPPGAAEAGVASFARFTVEGAAGR